METTQSNKTGQNEGKYTVIHDESQNVSLLSIHMNGP